MKEKVEEFFEPSIEGTLFEKICHLAELKDEEGLRELNSRQGIEFPHGNYLPVGYLAKQGKQDAVMLLIEKFNANRHHAVLCAAWGGQEELVDLLFSKENDEDKISVLLYNITRGFVRSYNRDMYTMMREYLHPSNKISALVNRLSEDLFDQISYDEQYLEQTAFLLESNYFVTEYFLGKIQFSLEGIEPKYLGLKYQCIGNEGWGYLQNLRSCIVDYQLEPLQAEKLLAATQGLQIWLLQAVRQLSTGLYIDENDKLQNTDNERPTLPIELLFHITKIAFNLPEVFDARKIMIAENSRLANMVIKKQENSMSYSQYSVIPQVLSFFGMNGPIEKKKEIEALIRREEDRNQKRISCIPNP
ncbi:hypothetical protein [Legionella sp. WA2024007413]